LPERGNADSRYAIHLDHRIEEDAVVILCLLHNHRRFPTLEDAGVKRKPKETTIASQIAESMIKPVSDLQARIAKLLAPRSATWEASRQDFIGGVRKAISGSKAEHRRHGRILKIILFGSYAKGKQVVDPVGRYFSDYDILVVVDHEDLTDASKYWVEAEDRMVDMLTDRGWPRPLNLIVHSLDEVNHALRRGRYFWVDLVREGIALAEEPGFPLEKPGVLTDQEAKEEAERYYKANFSGIGRSLKTSELQRTQSQLESDPIERSKWRNDAAFNLHQAAERSYYCVMLVSVLYQPKAHNINFLSKRAEQIDERLIGVWQTDTKFGRRCYELLRAAYIKARYSDQYKIDDDELDWIAQRVTDLQARVKAICEERLMAR
jgi:predicted nucleotidyltransferase/HEPN domain-containing protein